MSTASLESLWHAVEEAAPDNPMPLLVCADWCDEHERPVLAYALRWCAAHYKRPHRREKVRRKPWVWECLYSGSQSKTLHRRIPSVIWHGVVYRRLEVSFSSSFTAYVWLAKSLDSVREAVEIPTIVVPPPTVIHTGPVQCAGCGIMRARVASCPVCKSTDVAT